MSIDHDLRQLVTIRKWGPRRSIVYFRHEPVFRSTHGEARCFAREMRKTIKDLALKHATGLSIAQAIQTTRTRFEMTVGHTTWDGERNRRFAGALRIALMEMRKGLPTEACRTMADAVREFRRK